MKKILVSAIVIIYIVVAITVTFCLLNYNSKKVTQFGDKSLLIIPDDKLEPEYANGDLVIVDKKHISDVKGGEKIFFYMSDTIKIGEVRSVNKYEGVSSTFIMDGNYQVIEDDVIGSATTAKAYGKIGKVLSVIESKWGFLFIIIFPSILMCINEICQVIAEIRGTGEDQEDDREIRRRDDYDRRRTQSGRDNYERREQRPRERNYDRREQGPRERNYERREQRPREREYGREEGRRRNYEHEEEYRRRNSERNEEYRRERRD